MSGQVSSFDPTPILCAELKLPERGVRAALQLIAEGATVPFMARYRKEVTGGMDEVQLRTLEERAAELLELDKRRLAILGSLEELGKLDPALKAKIVACNNRAELEDLYLPFRPKRQTRASKARELGLEPLAQRILAQPERGDPEGEAARFVREGVADARAALAGARDIVAELGAEEPEVRAYAREVFARTGVLVSEVVDEAKPEAARFREYFHAKEPLRSMPSHRFMAVQRGEAEEVLRVRIDADGDRILARMLVRMNHRPRSAFGELMKEALADGYKRLLAPGIAREVLDDLRARAEREAVEVFAANLRDLLLASPLGGKAVVGVDPGLRTGCKCAALDATGTFLEFFTFYLPEAGGKAGKEKQALLAFLQKHKPEAVAVGNGTAGREAEAFVREVARDGGLSDLLVVPVSEAGASVYSASDVAREEFPTLDLTIRGAISIGRRLQDPLAELVKIEPKSIGVGQYQHDVHPPLLKKRLGEVVESCVNHVGVELNTASAPLLSYVAGIGPKLAQRIVARRSEKGPFRSRKELLEVSGLGPKTFEQAAGFLRVPGSAHPLDASAVHPERYALVERIAADLGVPLASLVGDGAKARQIPLQRYVSPQVGEPTLKDIVEELSKPGRDPRQSFEPPAFREDLRKVEDLKPGMELEGVVTNVTHFGAFVDVGVKQDGLVHISELADRFVKDPHEVVKAGQKLKVRVLGIDAARQRISLSARSPKAAR